MGGVLTLIRGNSVLAAVLFKSLEEVVRVVGRVVVDDVAGVVRVDLVDVLSELGAGLGLDLLDLLEAAGLHEGTLGFELGGKHFRELGAHVGEDVVGGELEEGFQGGHVGAHLDDVLERLLGLVLQSLEESGSMYTARRRAGTSASARNLLCSGEWRPIWPRAHAEAAFKWSSGLLISASLRGAIPLETITAMASH